MSGTFPYHILPPVGPLHNTHGCIPNLLRARCAATAHPTPKPKSPRTKENAPSPQLAPERHTPPAAVASWDPGIALCAANLSPPPPSLPQNPTPPPPPPAPQPHPRHPHADVVGEKKLSSPPPTASLSKGMRGRGRALARHLRESFLLGGDVPPDAGSRPNRYP